MRGTGVVLMLVKRRRRVAAVGKALIRHLALAGKSPYSNWIVCNAIEIDIKFHIKKYWQRISTFSNDNIYTYMENIELSKSNKKRGQPALELLLKVMGREMLGISI